MRSSGKGIRDVLTFESAAAVDKIWLKNDEACRLVKVSTRNVVSGGVVATGTLTTAVQTTHDGDKVKIGSVTYTFKVALSTPVTVPNEVLIGADEKSALDNLLLAINHGSTEGTEYSTGTVEHPLVTATTNTDTTQVINAKIPGLAGNSIVTEIVVGGSGHMSWGHAHLLGGESLTVQLRKCVTGEAPTAGDALLDTEASFSNANNTNQDAVIKPDPDDIMEAGSWIGLDFTGTVGSLAQASIFVLRRRLTGSY